MEGSAKRIVIRANSDQTTMLKGAFTQSNGIVSPKELKTLSEKTRLSEKWIHLWFRRQRARVRKETIDPASNSNPVLSPQEILEVKTEYRDSLVPKSSSPSAAILGRNIIENAPPNKKARVSQPRAQRAKKKQTTIQDSGLVDVDHTDPVADIADSSGSAPPSIARSSSSIFCNTSSAHPLNECPLVTQPAFPRIVPPSRTPLAPAPPGEDWRSSLSTNQSYRIYSPLATSDATTVNVTDSLLPPGILKSSKAVYQQGPRFHTQFYNNGPANYQNTRPTLGAGPAFRSDFALIPNLGSYLAEPMYPVSKSGRQNIPNQFGLGELFYQTLAPAIVLENTSKPTPSSVAPVNNYSTHVPSSFAQYIGSSTRAEGQAYPPYYYGRSNHVEYLDVKTEPENIDISAQQNPSTSRMKASQMTSPTYYNEAIDPSLAPLKHLTDVLERYRDQDGTYVKLIDLQERQGLMNCLLDDELARRNPFQAAMGLVLLSKLGLEWDY